MSYSEVINLLTTSEMEKPKGGRGHNAPYETKQMRVPVGLENQIQQLVTRYRDWISQAGFDSGIGTDDPPNLLDKAVDNFKEADLRSQLEALQVENAQMRLQLAEIKVELEDSQAKGSKATCDSEALQRSADRLLLELRVGKQSSEYKRTKAVINRFIAMLRQRD